MKEKMKVTLATALLVFFTVMFAGETLAYPNWIQISAPSKLGLVKNGKDINEGDYWALKFTVTYKNTKNSGRIITALFAKTLSIENIKPDATYLDQPYQYYSPLTSTVTSSKINKLEVWPNSSAKLSYFIPLNKLIKANKPWKTVNEWFGKNSTPFKYESWSHDFQARSEKM
jgi:hypothetical protein